MRIISHSALYSPKHNSAHLEASRWVRRLKAIYKLIGTDSEIKTTHAHSWQFPGRSRVLHTYEIQWVSCELFSSD